MTWLNEIRKRVNKATPGPWVSAPEGVYENQLVMNPICSSKTGFSSATDSDRAQDEANMEFISRSREDIPKLLDYIDGLHRGIEIRDNLMHWENNADENCALEESCGSCIRKWAEENVE